MKTTKFAIMEKSHLDLLAEALYDGEVVADDFKVMPGSSEELSEEQSAKVLYESMRRMGVINDGRLAKVN